MKKSQISTGWIFTLLVSVGLSMPPTEAAGGQGKKPTAEHCGDRHEGKNDRHPKRHGHPKHHEPCDEPAVFDINSSELLLHWTFDEDGEVIIDSSGNGHDIVGLGDGVREDDLQRGRILYLRDKHAQLSTVVSGFDETEPFSVAFWIKPEVLRSYTQQVGGGFGQFLFRLNRGGGMAGGIHEEEVMIAAEVDGDFATDQWQHVAFTYERGYARLYMDGRIIGAKHMTAPDAWASFELKNIAGRIDDVRVYNRRLHSDEVEQLVDPSSAFGESVLFWRFDAAGDVILDSSGNGNEASINDGVRVMDPERGQVLALSDSDREIESSINGFDATLPFTVNFWIRPTDFDSYNQQIGPGWGQFIFRANNRGGMHVGIQNQDYFSASQLDDELTSDAWQMITFTYDEEGEARVYKNAQLIGSKAMAGPEEWQGFSLNKVDGRLDDVQVFNRSLDAPAVQQLYAGGSTPDDTPYNLGEERYETTLLWQYSIIPGASSPEIPPHKPGWNVLKGFGTLTSDGTNYYLVYLDTEARPKAVKITPNGDDFSVEESFVEDTYSKHWTVRADGHHHMALEVDAQGYLHLVGDMHNYPNFDGPQDHLPDELKNQKILYWRTTSPGDITSFQFEGGGDSAPKGTGYTYNRFAKDPAQNLYLTARYDMMPGAQANGGRNRRGFGLTRYEAQAGEWVTIGARPNDEALTEVVFWERYADTSGAPGYTKLVPRIAFDRNNVLHTAIGVNRDDEGVDYTEVAEANGSPDSFAHYNTEVAYLRSDDLGASFSDSSGETLVMPSRLEAGPQQAEILFSADLVNHIVDVGNTYVAVDYRDQPVVSFRRGRLNDSEPNRTNYRWYRDGSWQESYTLGAQGQIEDISEILHGPEGDLLFTGSNKHIYRLWTADGHHRRDFLPFRPDYVSANYFRSNRELLCLSYDEDSEIVSVYRVAITRDDQTVE